MQPMIITTALVSDEQIDKGTDTSERRKSRILGCPCAEDIYPYVVIRAREEGKADGDEVHERKQRVSPYHLSLQYGPTFHATASALLLIGGWSS